MRKLCSATFLGCALAGTMLAAPAWAQKGPVQVVSIDSDDAEDQADAFTGALKSRLRAIPSWTPAETTNSFGPLAAALKCPPKPDAACLGRIGDQLKTDRFFWGTAQKAGKNMVQVELHLWARNKPDQSVKETYSDNLKDQNDDALKKIVARMVDKLGAVAPTGPAPAATYPLHVQANADDGAIVIDGKEVGKIAQGAATIDVAAGHHEIEVRAGDGRSAKRSLDVSAEQSVQLELVAAAPPPPPPPSKPFPTRKVIGFTTAGLGLVSIAIGVVEGVQFLNYQSKNDSDHKNPVFTGVKDFCSTSAAPLAGPMSMPCQNVKDGETARTLELVLLGVGGALVVAGAVIVLTDPGPKAAEPAQAKVRLVPSIGPHGGALGLVGTF